MQRKVKIILKLVTTILVCVVVFFALSISATRLFGLQVYGVLTGSMEPVYPTGSLIYVKDVNTDKLEVGDVISFKVSANVIATHRIVELVPDESDPNIVRYRTKGDANDVVDASLVDKYNIIGKVVFCIPKMGYFMEFIQSPSGIATTVGASAALVVLVFISEVYTASNKTKMKWKGAIIKRLLGPDAVPPQMQQPVRRSPSNGPQRRPVPQQRPRYEDEYRPRRHSYDQQPRRRYEDEYPTRSERRRYDQQPRRRYEDEYPTRSERRRYEEQPRRRYEDEYPTRTERRRYEESASRTPSRQPRYEDEYRPRRSRYDD